MRKKRVSIITLGCPKNFVEAENITGLLLANNCAITNNISESDFAIVHTCSFIRDAKLESLRIIKALADIRSSGDLEKLVVTGCLAQELGAGLLNKFTGIDAIIGTDKLLTLPEILKSSDRTALLGAGGLLESDFQRILSSDLSYAYLKISEGCNHKCSFCIIPRLRGKYISRKISSVVKEANDLSAIGINELVLIAQDTTSYGIDIYNRPVLDLLIDKLSRVEGIDWIRLLYAYPTSVTDKLIKVFKNNTRICRYIDMPLQHISTRVLKAMRRPLGAKEVTENLLERVPDIAIRTTFIVGHPAETERDFYELMRFVENGYFEHAGVFQYSHEPGAPDRGLKDVVKSDIKTSRMKLLMNAQKSVSEKKNKSRIGSVVDVHVDYTLPKPYNGVYQSIARAGFQAPEIDGKIYLKGNILQGAIIKAKIVKAEAYDLFAEAITLTGK